MYEYSQLYLLNIVIAGFFLFLRLQRLLSFCLVKLRSTRGGYVGLRLRLVLFDFDRLRLGFPGFLLRRSLLGRLPLYFIWRTPCAVLVEPSSLVQHDYCTWICTVQVRVHVTKHLWTCKDTSESICTSGVHYLIGNVRRGSPRTRARGRRIGSCEWSALVAVLDDALLLCLLFWQLPGALLLRGRCTRLLHFLKRENEGACVLCGPAIKSKPVVAHLHCFACRWFLFGLLFGFWLLCSLFVRVGMIIHSATIPFLLLAGVFFGLGWRLDCLKKETQRVKPMWWQLH